MKVGFLIDSYDVPEFVAELYEECTKIFGADLVIIRNHFNEENKLTISRRIREFGLKRSFHKASYNLLAKLEHKLLSRSGRVDPNTCAGKLQKADKQREILISPLKSKANIVYRYDDETIDMLKREKFDVLVRGEGRGLLKGDILNVAKHGILSFHHSDNRKICGGPPGFWEIMLGERNAGFIVQQLDNSIDNGPVLARGQIKASASQFETRDQLFSASVPVFVELLASFKATGKLPKSDKPLAKPGPHYTTPTLFQTLTYLWRKSNYAKKPDSIAIKSGVC